MTVSSDHVLGFALGVGAAAAGYYFYKQNQNEVDAFLAKHGIDMPAPTSVDAESLTIEQLVAEKERLEDFIAEREYAESQKDAGDKTHSSAPETEQAK